MSESVGGEFTNRVDSPRAVVAWCPSVARRSALHRYHLVIAAGSSNVSDLRLRSHVLL